MRVWREREDNKYVKLNADEVFDFERVTTTTQPVLNNEGNGDDEEGAVDEEVPSVFIEKSTSYTRQSDGSVINSNEIREMHDDVTFSVTSNITHNGREQGKVIVDHLHIREISNEINGTQNGPYERFNEGPLVWKSYKDNGDTEGITTTFYLNGMIHQSISYKHSQYDGDYINYRNAVNSPIDKISKFTDGEKLSTTYYQNNSHVEANHVKDGMIKIQPISYDFYNLRGVLTRRITNPIGLHKTKVDTVYDDDGNIVSETEYGKNQVFNINTMKW